MTITWGSSEWLDVLEQALKEEVAKPEFHDVTFSSSETYENLPPHLITDGVPLGWSVRIRNGTVDFARHTDETAEYQFVLTYEASVAASRVYAGPEFDVLKKRLSESGARRVLKSPPEPLSEQTQAMLHRVHDALTAALWPDLERPSPEPDHSS